jgi:alpha-1,6-mannosyltransferase
MLRVAPGLRDGAARLGALCAWTFAALLAYAARLGVHSVFEGFSWLRLALSALFLACCALYWLWLRGAPTASAEDQSWPRAVASGWPILAAALVSAPISTDAMLYLHYGAMALAGVNPYLTNSGALQTAFSALVEWDQPCVYGPLALGLFSAVAALQSPLLGVLALKLLWLAAHVAGAAACFHAHPVQRAWAARAFAFNPILLLAFVVDVHLDALTCALLLWSFTALARERALSAFGLLCAAIFTKSVAVLALPLWFAWALSRRRFALAAAATALLALLVALLASSVLPNVAAWRSLLNPITSTGRSVQHVLVLSGQWLAFDGGHAAAIYAWVARCLYLACAVVVWVRALRRPYAAAALASDFALLLLLACLYVVPFVPWWYCALILAAVWWSPSAAWLRAPAFTFGVCAALTLSAGSGLSKAGFVGSLLAIVPTSAVLLRSYREASRAGFVRSAP